MKKFIYISFLFCLLAAFHFDLFANKISKADSLRIDSINHHLVIILPESAILAETNDFVQPYIEQYSKEDNKQLQLMLLRGKNVLPTISKIFKEEGVPDELKYLAYIESNFNTHITSPYGAKGMWQFMRGTAMNYGLRINNKVDERTDTEKSTRAAARYFKKLYENYGDWLLVIAAYNCGDGAVTYAVNKTGNNNFWDVYKILPRQTKVYVPHFLGILNVMNTYAADLAVEEYRQQHEINKTETTEEKVVNTAVATTTITTDLSKSNSKNNAVSNSTIETKTVTEAVVKQATTVSPSPANPPSPIASGTTEMSFPDIYQKNYFIYIVRKGDTLQSIADRFPKNNSMLIKQNNNVYANSQLEIGSTILLEK